MDAYRVEIVQYTIEVNKQAARLYDDAKKGVIPQIDADSEILRLGYELQRVVHGWKVSMESLMQHYQQAVLLCRNN
jgi:hypothetical protein